MLDFRSLLEEINASVARHDQVSELLERGEESLTIAQNLVNDLKQTLSEKEEELKLAQDSVDQLKEKQVAVLKLIWDTEAELHALMPDHYKEEISVDLVEPEDPEDHRVESFHRTSSWPS